MYIHYFPFTFLFFRAYANENLFKTARFERDKLTEKTCVTGNGRSSDKYENY